MGVRNVVIADNRIETVSQDYKEQAAILVTYAAVRWSCITTCPTHPMTGSTSVGAGASTIRAAAAPIAPGRAAITTSRAISCTIRPRSCAIRVVQGNRVHKVKQWFADGGAIYHLSADPGALIAENFVYDVPGGIGLYLDEGSRYVHRPPECHPGRRRSG